MVPIYAIAVVVGFLLLVPFIVGWVKTPRRDVAGLTIGFGLAGMSSTFAGWSPFLAFLAAVGGAVAIAGGSRFLAPRGARTGAVE